MDVKWNFQWIDHSEGDFNREAKAENIVIQGSMFDWLVVAQME